MDQNDLRPVMTHQLATLLADGIGHDDDGFVPAHGTNERQADALVAAGGLHNDGVRLDEAFLLGIADHVVGRAGLDGTADIQAFKFDKNLGISGLIHTVQADHGGVSHGLKDVVIDHSYAPFPTFVQGFINIITHSRKKCNS